MPKKPAAPVLLVRWYDYTKWLLERVDSFPKNQRFIFGTRLADAVLASRALLVEASYSSRNGVMSLPLWLMQSSRLECCELKPSLRGLQFAETDRAAVCQKQTGPRSAGDGEAMSVSLATQKKRPPFGDRFA